MHYLYRITDILNSKVYIGQTINVEKRWTAHKSYAKNPEKTGQYIHRAMAKYGIDSFTYEIIAQCLTQKDADETEAKLIEQYQSRDKQYGYNRAPGGNIAWESGLPSVTYPMYGKHHSKESKEKISTSQIKKTNSDDSKAKMTIAAKLRKPNGRGPKSGSKHMTYETIVLIRSEYDLGNISFTQLAKKYNCSIGTISNLINKKSRNENDSRNRQTR